MQSQAPPAQAGRYTTVAGEYRRELHVQRSRFIAVLRRVENEEQSDRLVEQLRREFPDARHHCSAVLIGPTRHVQRAHDDGEPSGTAGTPMLEALRRRQTSPGRTDLSDVAAVVVRYFGGTLLGAGGLLRAYSDAVSQALDDCSMVDRRRLRCFDLSVDHSSAGRLEHELRNGGVQLAEANYSAAGVVLRAAVTDSADHVGRFEQRVATLTGGACTPVDTGTRWTDMP